MYVERYLPQQAVVNSIGFAAQQGYPAAEDEIYNGVDTNDGSQYTHNNPYPFILHSLQFMKVRQTAAPLPPSVSFIFRSFPLQ